jgi:Spy/CpxP family protein refolding chaperone
MGARFLLSLTLLFASLSIFAGPTPGQNTPDIDAYIAKLDNISHLPNMLPVILNNKDFIGLTDEQVKKLEHWREKNRKPLLAVMKQATQKRVEIKQAALSPTVSSARLQQMQNDIFRLQRQILEYKLSCRDRVVRTFNDENWDSFFMVLAGEDIGIPVPVSFAEK